LTTTCPEIAINLTTQFAHSTQTEGETTEKQGAIHVSGGESQVLGSGTTNAGGNVLGESTQTPKIEEQNVGGVEGTSSAAKGLFGKWWFWLLFVLAILFGANASKKRK
jgi:hypothetical protein